MIQLIKDSAGAARELMERVQRDGGSLAQEYPLVFDERFDGAHVAIGGEGAVESACTILARTFHVGDHQVRGGMIGSVSTDPDARGKGLGTRLVVEAEAALQVDGCAFVLLWGEDPGFYLKRGFCPAGVEYDFVIAVDEVDRLPEVEGVRELGPADLEAVHALYCSHPSHVERTVEELRAMLECPGMTSLVLERDGQVVAYALRGRGLDLAEAVHEWGGAPEDVLGLVRAHVQRASDSDLRGLVLMVPGDATAMRVALGERGVPEHAGILGLGKILHRPTAAALIDGVLGEHGSCRVVATEDGERFEISGPKETGALDDNGALALLFPTIELRPAVEEFLARFGLIDTDLPMTPFVWGLDSI